MDFMCMMDDFSASYIPKKREGKNDKKENHGPKTFTPHTTDNKEEHKQTQNVTSENTTENSEA